MKGLSRLTRLEGVAMAIVASLVFAAQASTQESRNETLPFQTDGAPFLTDVWRFSCLAGGSATVSADTQAISEATDTPLDLVLSIFDQAGLQVAVADDEVTCSVAPVCAYQCPIVTFDCPGSEEMTVQVWTANALGCGESAGAYQIVVEVFDGPGGTGTSQPASVVRLGGGEPVRAFPWGRYPWGPAQDDIFVSSLFALPTAPATLFGEPLDTFWVVESTKLAE